MDSLCENKQFLELVTLMSVVLEKELQDLILKYEEFINILSKEQHIIFCTKSFKNKNRMTLGQLKKYLSVYCNNTEMLNKVEKFNKLRIKTVHKVFDHNMEELEMEIKSYYRKYFFKLLFEMSTLKCELLCKIMNKR